MSTSVPEHHVENPAQTESELMQEAKSNPQASGEVTALREELRRARLETSAAISEKGRFQGLLEATKEQNNSLIKELAGVRNDLTAQIKSKEHLETSLADTTRRLNDLSQAQDSLVKDKEEQKLHDQSQIKSLTKSSHSWIYIVIALCLGYEGDAKKYEQKFAGFDPAGVFATGVDTCYDAPSYPLCHDDVQEPTNLAITRLFVTLSMGRAPDFTIVNGILSTSNRMNLRSLKLLEYGLNAFASFANNLSDLEMLACLQLKDLLMRHSSSFQVPEFDFNSERVLIRAFKRSLGDDSSRSTQDSLIAQCKSLGDCYYFHEYTAVFDYDWLVLIKGQEVTLLFEKDFKVIQDIAVYLFFNEKGITYRVRMKARSMTERIMISDIIEKCSGSRREEGNPNFKACSGEIQTLSI